MARNPYILAQNTMAAHAYAREELGMENGTYRVVNHPSTVLSVRGVELILAPGHELRFDRFAMANAIRYTKMTIVDHSERAPAPEEPKRDSVPDELTPPGEQMLIDAPPDWPVPSATTPADEPDEPRRRRSRCKKCGALHFKNDSCPADDTILGL